MLTRVQKKHYDRDGYLVVRQVLTSNEVDLIRTRLEQIVLGTVSGIPADLVTVRDVPGRGSFGNVSSRPTTSPEPPQQHTATHLRRGTQVFPVGGEPYAEQLWGPVQNPLDAVSHLRVLRQDEVLGPFVRHPKIVDVVAELMSPNIKLYYDQVFAKPPYGPANRYHQDSVFWNFFASKNLLTAWIAIDNATVENGCVRYIPGSHEFGLIDWDHLPYLLTGDVLAGERMTPLDAGDVVFHHSLTLHCSGPNPTPQRRWGWALHYVPAEARYIGTPQDDAHLWKIHATDRPDPHNGFPLVRGREFPGCV
ncbi:MAG: phytanoyl-CoA dioxygenase family protein [Planctomycetes bacterium]|nr:phytanoyl-CoA dioxygenase family protein [Planctomycetota bacterium]